MTMNDDANRLNNGLIPSSSDGAVKQRTHSKLCRSISSSQNQNGKKGSPESKDFFDGSYFSANESKLKGKALFDYSQPSWAYLYTSCLVVLDVLMTIIGSIITFLIYPDSRFYLQRRAPHNNAILEFILLAICAWIISLLICEAYSRHVMGEGYELYSKILKAALIDFVMICTLGYILKLDIPRSLAFGVPLFTGCLTLLERWLMRRALHYSRRKGEFVYSTILIGSPKAIHQVCKQLQEDSGIGYKPIAVCPVALDKSEKSAQSNTQHLISTPFIPENEEEAKLKVLSVNSHLAETAKIFKAHTVLITDVLSHNSETTRTLSLAVESMGIELAIATSVADLGGASLHFRNDPNMPVLTAKLPQYTTRARILKRVMDIALSIVAIILTGIPMILIAYMIHREDKGPVIFSQKRIGILGRPFIMYKFRSMRPDAEELKAKLAKENGLQDRFIFKMKDDPRITKFGHFIRKTSLDELPQFFNVLKGDMSLVGPRPPLPEEVAKYDTLYSSRLLVKPGITGPWQVSGRSALNKEQSEFADVSYIQNWSFTGDIAILLKTVMVMIRGTGM
ncbi:sugar transferase [Bifidobacterium sp. ESL0690]|uniref:sugar transferase n=1 Tax=Bifidobacterium sp. ESL0690 TaxID=2983214 RepID=UPI0023F76447|nr:sugar transferase [Bifidobacterium sp. ESL0690]WEV47066.1 sugar transferase [Bifidobacterium sp. ESL0690]